jgi:NIMA (never in mitosis gene a)-related kinase 1/4/5
LNYLHVNKILHRDIKSYNIFLTDDDNVRIGDLGVAKIISDTSNFAHTIVGTPYYLSPELCEERPYNQKSDVWALGCVLYEMCCLRHPFEATSQAALALKIIKGKYKPIPTTFS